NVVNEQGERISIGQGIGRYFAYILSGIIFYIGFI
ncbi:RDD family protein, partial [Bacillus spizizenii]|nr:RDD family protein [Bacillus spizizenii]